MTIEVSHESSPKIALRLRQLRGRGISSFITFIDYIWSHHNHYIIIIIIIIIIIKKRKKKKKKKKKKKGVTNALWPSFRLNRIYCENDESLLAIFFPINSIFLV